ncbi:MAG: DUF928 domain-containing protein [Coleofasciculaceae cyanobacterium SM2_1_6]|nr:DUF928 domain-containing protein [Coleofasciculaceae cyanobacterium SM2_1_6]
MSLLPLLTPLTIFALLTSWSFRAIAGEQRVLIAQSFQPPDRGAPSNSGGGGTRGNGEISISANNIIPLVPRDQATNVLWGQTLSETPTFFLYVPAQMPSPIKFYLVDDTEGELIYEETVIPPAAGGIMAIDLPRNPGKTLQVEKLYNWYFEIQVNSQPSVTTRNPIVGGFVRRIVASPELSSKLQTASSANDRSQIYADHGIWYDLLATAASLRTTNPGNWELLLNSVGLEALVEAPLITAIDGATNNPVANNSVNR